MARAAFTNADGTVVGATEVSQRRRFAAIPTAPRVLSRMRLSFQLIAYEIHKAHVGSVLGMTWAVLYPLLFLGLYLFVFAALDANPGGRTEVEDQLLVLLSGLVPWFFFSHSVAAALGGLLNRAQLVTQINFPVGVLPFVSVGPRAADFAIGLALLTAMTAVAGNVTWMTLLLVPAALLLAAFVVSVSAVVAPAVVMLRDLRTIVPLTLRAGLFLSPVLYLPSALPEGLSFVAEVNPLTYFIAVTRAATMQDSDIGVLGTAADLGIAAGVTAVAVIVAWRSRSFARRAADYL